MQTCVRTDCGCPTNQAGGAALLVESPPPPSPPHPPPPPATPPLNPSPTSPPPTAPCVNLHEFKDIRGYDIAAYNGYATDWDCFHKLRQEGHSYGVRNHNTLVCMAKSQFVDSYNDHATAIDVTCGIAPPLTLATPVSTASAAVAARQPARTPARAAAASQEVQTNNITVQSFRVATGAGRRAASAYHRGVHDAFRASSARCRGRLLFVGDPNSYAANVNVTIVATPGRRLQQDMPASTILECDSDYAGLGIGRRRSRARRSTRCSPLPSNMETTDNDYQRCGATRHGRD